MIYNKNLFRVSDLSAAGQMSGNPLIQSISPPERLDLSYFDNTIEKGQIIMISFDFQCNLDKDLKKCNPEITLWRIDNSSFSSGFVSFFIFLIFYIIFLIEFL